MIIHLCWLNTVLIKGHCPAIIWTNAGLLSIGLLGTNFNEIIIKIKNSLLMKMHLKISSAKWQPFCPGVFTSAISGSSRLVVLRFHADAFARQEIKQVLLNELDHLDPFYKDQLKITTQLRWPLIHGSSSSWFDETRKSLCSIWASRHIQILMFYIGISTSAGNPQCISKGSYSLFRRQFALTMALKW